MIGSGKAIGEFIDAHRCVGRGCRPPRLPGAAGAAPARRRRTPRSSTAADSGYYAELVRRERFDVDAQQVRQLLRLRARCSAGLLDVTGRLFGVTYRPVPDAPAWHAGRRRLRRAERRTTRELLGRIYLDLHPREGKYKHAAQFDLVAGRHRPPAARGRARLQLLARADGARPTSSRCSTSSVTWSTTSSAGGSGGCGSPGWPPNGTSSRRRRSCWRSGRGTPKSCARSPPTRTASRSPPSWSRGCGRRRSSARAISPAPRCSTPRCPTGCTWTGQPTSPPRCASCRRATTCSAAFPGRTSRTRSVTWRATPRRITPICGAW